MRNTGKTCRLCGRSVLVGTPAVPAPLADSHLEKERDPKRFDWGSIWIL